MRIYTYFALFCVSLILASCSDNEDNNISSPTEEVVPGTNHHILIAYFSEPLPDGVDANTSASRVIVNGDLYGSVEYMATVIGEATGADMVRIQTATPYPGNFDDLASQADNERQNNIHPALAYTRLCGCRPLLQGFAHRIGKRPDSSCRRPLPHVCGNNRQGRY